jgi:hypothetical protein
MRPGSIVSALAALAFVGSPAMAQAPAAPPAPTETVTVHGPAAAAVVGATELQGLRRDSVSVGWGGGHTYAGAALGELLAKAGAPPEAALRGAALAQVVVVKGADGFIGVLALAETSMSFKSQPVILADQEDGKPLNAEEGPYRLVIGGELKPARSVRNVVDIELRPIR